MAAIDPMPPDDPSALGTIKAAGLGDEQRGPSGPRPLLALAVRTALRVASWLPLPLLHGVAGALGWTAAAFPGRERRLARRHLRMAYPEASDAEIVLLARAALAQSARMVAEHAPFWCWPRERLLARIVEVRGEQHLRAAREAGRGVVLGAIHLGSIEAVNTWIASTYGLTAQYRKPRVAELDPLFRHARERFGNRLLPTGRSSVRLLIKALAAGEIVGIPPDQDPGTGQGIFVPFFGRLTHTMTLIPRLAAAREIDVVIAWAERLPRGRYRMNIEPVGPAVAGGDLVAAATALNAAIERAVRSAPEQYLWSYNRWRVQPSHVELYERHAREARAAQAEAGTGATGG